MRSLLVFSALEVALLAAVIALPAPVRADFQILEFSVNGVAATQSSGGNSYSGQAAWNPTIGLGGFDLRGDLGVSLLKSTFDTTFAAFDYQVFLKWGVLPVLSVEGGGGLQTWVNNGGTSPIAGGNLNLEFPGKLFTLFDRIFVGYSRYFLTGNGTNEFRLGLGIAI